MEPGQEVIFRQQGDEEAYAAFYDKLASQNKIVMSAF